MVWNQKNIREKKKDHCWEKVLQNDSREKMLGLRKMESLASVFSGHEYGWFPHQELRYAQIMDLSEHIYIYNKYLYMYISYTCVALSRSFYSVSYYVPNTQMNSEVS